MSARRMRGIAAASLVFAAGAWLSLGGSWRVFAANAQTSGQNPAPVPAPIQVNPPAEAPPATAQNQNAVPNAYRPAAVLSAADVQFPFQTPADGVVVFDVSLGPSGELRKINVLNNVPPFTAAAKGSLHSWKFSPASEAGRPEESEMLVAFVFRHAVYIANEPPFTPLVPSRESAEARRGFVPPGVLSISYAAYPASTIAMGAVVVQANVEPNGSVGEVSTVRDIEGGFKRLAIDAAKHWRFQPASREGRPVPSKVAIAFVFSSRALNPF
jgi:TonB family protein